MAVLPTRFVASCIVLLAASAGAQHLPAGAPSGKAGHDVVVTGRRLSDTDAALKACIARHCPPDDEIRAALSHAENQFVAGDYKRARVTLQDAAARNRRYAKDYPVPVSDLLRAESRVAVHLGEVDDYRRTTLGSLDALKAGLPGDDPRVIAERLEVGDMFAHVNQFEKAMEIYRTVARQTRMLDLPTLEGTARLRSVVIDYHAATGGFEFGSEHDALREMDALAYDPDPRLASYAFVARVMRAEYDSRHGDPAPLARVMAEMRTKLGGTRPILLRAEPVNLVQRPAPVDLLTSSSLPKHETLTRTPMASYEGQWVDVSFWIRRDGTVDDVGVLRESAPTVRDWTPSILEAVRTREYAPLALPNSQLGLLRVERYTFTSYFDDTAMGTRLPTRDGQPKVEMLDLSDR